MCDSTSTCTLNGRILLHDMLVSCFLIGYPRKRSYTLVWANHVRCSDHHDFIFLDGFLQQQPNEK